jgi:hypothetical protein
VTLPKEGEQHASNANVGMAESSVFARATVTTTTVEWVSFRASSDDSGFKSTSCRNTTDTVIGFTSPLLLQAQIEERAQSKTEM